MKKLILAALLLSAFAPVWSQTVNSKMIPATTKSGKALDFYVKAKKYYDDVNAEKALESFQSALKEDPDFFMVNYQLALFSLLNQSDDFYEYADAALACKSKLSEGENILKDALAVMRQGRKNVVQYGKQLIGLYPDDPESYNNLVSFQSLAGDSDGMVETLEKAVSVFPRTASFYNQLGYAYLAVEQAEKAGAAFDKYIELDPANANVYDSKGDYYMFVKKYGSAYDSYMKAYHMNNAFGKEKADVASRMHEQNTGKKIGVVSM